MAINVRRCSKCEQLKPLSEFHTDKRAASGHRSDCRECRRKPVLVTIAPGCKICRRCNSTKPIEMFNRQGDGKKSWCKSCEQEYKRLPAVRERKRLSARQNRTAEKRESRRIYSRLYRERHPDRAAARRAVNNAIKMGKLKPARVNPCSRCGEMAAQYHHHKGYEQKYWLEVEPLCAKCHVSVHQ